MDYWLKQTKDQPLFPDILWARPENRQAAGKLLIIGGNLHSFSVVGQSYQMAVKAGVGTARVLLPDALKKTVGQILDNCLFAPSNPSGSFAKTGLTECLAEAAWADAVLLAGDFGHNSETAILLETFVDKYPGLIIFSKDALDYFLSHPSKILDRPKTLIVGSLGQLQKIAMAARNTEPISIGQDMVRLVEVLHNFSGLHQAHLLTNHTGTLLLAADNKISSTQTDKQDALWQTETAAQAAVFWLQNPDRPFESISSAVI